MLKVIKGFTLALCMLGFDSLRVEANISDVQIETIHVSGPVYMLVGSGGNIGVSAGEDGILLIDDQFAPLSAKIQEALDEISSSPLRFVLNIQKEASGAAIWISVPPAILYVRPRGLKSRCPNS